ncbi:MAG TPA: hypothetical protein VHE37_03985, partial [Nevskiaceae bacterium]|nr:hypothetical protein [Nevskiaceae bacterium]
APAEAAPAADSTASSGSDSSSSGSSETASSDSGSAPSETPANPHKLYLGAEYNRLTLSISDPAMATNFGGSTFTTRMYTVRAGIRVFDVMGLELQGGIKGDNGNDPGKAELSSYYGAFFVPTGNVFDLFEVSATLGYNAFTLSRGNASVKFARPAFGVNAELPIREISESLPDLRFTAGYKVYYEEHDSRVYGFHAGLRYDFQL